MRGARFGKAARLRHPQAFRRVFSDGRRYVDAHFVVIAAESTGDRARLGMAISRRRARRAIDRNRIKRLVRESFRQRSAKLPAVDIVVLARSGTSAQRNAVLFASLERHWDRVVADHVPAASGIESIGPSHG